MSNLLTDQWKTNFYNDLRKYNIYNLRKQIVEKVNIVLKDDNKDKICIYLLSDLNLDYYLNKQNGKIFTLQSFQL